MSRLHHDEPVTTAVAGSVALPSPTGRPDEIRSAARDLERAASRARATATVSGTLAPRLRAVWTGEAATAAEAEAHELCRRSRAVVDALPVAARSVHAYAVALEIAQRRVVSLQRQWDALDVEHAAVLGGLGLPDPSGVLGAVGRQHADEARVAGRVRLSQAYRSVIDQLEADAGRSARTIYSLADATLPAGISPTSAAVRSAVTGGLWFADGVAAVRTSRDAAITDAALMRRIESGAQVERGATHDLSTLIARLRAHAGDPVYAQALVEEVGTNGLGRLALVIGGPSASVDLDTVRQLLGVMGSVVVSATQQVAPAGTDPRTRTQIASWAALLTDDIVSGATTTLSDPAHRQRAAGYWLLGQMLAGARLSGDTRPLPARMVRRAAAAAATAEITETRDTDVELRHGTTAPAHGDAAFASWFDASDFDGDALHLLLREVGDDPAEQSALLAEPLPDSTVAGSALDNARGDRLTLGEHLVRRWITFEANGSQTHPDLHLQTDDDLTRMLEGVSAGSTTEAAEIRARLMLEVSRASAHAMGEASTTRIYNRAAGAVEHQVVEWLSAMHANVDRALGQPVLSARAGYSAETATGPQPSLDAHELSGVVAALALDTGMGLHARAPSAAYGRLVETEIESARQATLSGEDPTRGVARLGFFDQAASAALVGVARRQDDLNRSAWESTAETAHVVDEIRRAGPAGLVSVVQTYASGGSLRTPEEDLLISVVRSDVELQQTELDDSRRAALLARIEGLVGHRSGEVGAAFREGAGRAPCLATAHSLRKAREDEIRAAWNAVRDSRSTDRLEGGRPRRSPDHTIAHVAEGRNGRIPELDSLPRGKNSTIKLVESDDDLRDLTETLTRGATPLEPGRYPGTRWLRDDGVEVRLRESSTSGGATIDLVFPDGSKRKVHIR
ncbi:hypothetical protein [Terrabacter sp. 2RAF25]|uniref:hypothetical protein n=1 Tax=Terrabacter sp. 2RAF25 TaxID=3232998 RepID=UPI003F985669